MLAADHLVYKLGSKTNIDWAAVRPDSLFDEESVRKCKYIIIKYEVRFLIPAKQAE